MANDYISREAAISIIMEACAECMDACAEFDGLVPDCDECMMNGAKKKLATITAADVRPVVLCRDCKHRIVNEHYGEKGYMKLKAMCELDTGDIFEFGRNAWGDDWFCADGEART